MSNDFKFKIIGNIEIKDKRTHSVRKFNLNNVHNLRILHEMDTKFDWGIFFPKKKKKRFMNEEGEWIDG